MQELLWMSFLVLSTVKTASTAAVDLTVASVKQHLCVDLSVFVTSARATVDEIAISVPGKLPVPWFCQQ